VLFIPGGDEVDDNDDDDDDAVDDVVYESCIFFQQILILHNFPQEKIVILLHLCENNSQAIMGIDSHDR